MEQLAAGADSSVVETLLLIARWGGGSILFVTSVLQLQNLFWVLYQRVGAILDARRLAPLHRASRTVERSVAWRSEVEPYLGRLMSVGPVVGIFVSTLLSARGLGSLGQAMALQEPGQLSSVMASAYSDISQTYYFIAAGLLPLLLGALAGLAARPIESAGDQVRGGEEPDLQLDALTEIAALLRAGRTSGAAGPDSLHGGTKR